MSRKNRKLQNPMPNEFPSATDQTEKFLAYLLEKRSGGSINFRGIGFQILYATRVVLQNLSAGAGSSVTLEGYEDIDLNLQENRQYIQVKTSRNPIDAATLWSLNVLQHFWELFEANLDCRFVLAHNTSFTKGNTEILGNVTANESAFTFWSSKFHSAGIAHTDDQLKHFFNKITLEQTNETVLLSEIRMLLFDKYHVNLGTESQYFKALFYHVFDWSSKRQTIKITDLQALFQSVKDSFSKFPVNPAVLHNWIAPVVYEVDSAVNSNYYDGKAATPEDIANNLPVRRMKWEQEVSRRIEENDVVVIKSSSGQGKSTLAWQTGYMKRKFFQVYQLNICRAFEEASAIADFLKSRLLIGEFPLVIIDGLNRNNAAWDELAHLLTNQPVKFLITTREEDWIRFGGDISKLSLKVLDIFLSMEEAADIFQELKQRGKLHQEISSWQPAWEKVKDKELLIEYIFLLTQGQMIQERLQHQSDRIACEEGAGAKLEILRLITLADTLNIRIKTSKLTSHVSDLFSNLDRNAVYRQLEKEYYLRFDNNYVEGLHPVRSQHLVQILHSHIDVDESLLALLKIVDENYIYDYFITAPLIVQLDDDFYRSAAMIVARKTLVEIVFCIDGLMHFEPYRYWKENQKIFDEVSKNGGLSLFVYDATPFYRQNTIASLSATMGPELSANLNYLLRKLSELTMYSIEDSSLFRFIKYLQPQIASLKVDNPEGISFLFKWFKRVGVPFPLLSNMTETQLLESLVVSPISESSELFHFYSLVEPEKYKAFITQNREHVLSRIKQKTNSVAIYENGVDIYIEYMLDGNDQLKVNEQSMYRINIVHAFFPFYERYCTSLLVLPFPNDKIYEAIIQEAEKHIPKENLLNDFDIHINQIWAKTILDQYACGSSYEWQQQMITFRESTLELVKKITRLFEAHLEKNQSRIRNLAKDASVLGSRVLFLDTSWKKYPSSGKKYFDKAAFEEEQRKLSDWSSALRNFINQLSGIFTPKKEHDRHLPLVNLRCAVFHLVGMHQAFQKIVDGSHEYFDTAEIKTAELTWFPRLLQTVRFYVDQAKAGFPNVLADAARGVAAWNAFETKRKLDQLHSILNDFEEKSGFKFYYPLKILEEEYCNVTAFAIEEFDVSSEEDLWELSIGLRSLADTDVDFFTLLIIDHNKEVKGSIRFKRDYFQAFKTLVLTGENDGDIPTPLTVFPDEEIISLIDGISMKKITADPAFESYFRMMINVWQLSEYRRNLTAESDRLWLDELERLYQGSIRQSLEVLMKNEFLKEFIDVCLMDRFIREEKTISKETVIALIFKATVGQAHSSFV